jgi:hypothetical protein
MATPCRMPMLGSRLTMEAPSSFGSLKYSLEPGAYFMGCRGEGDHGLPILVPLLYTLRVINSQLARRLATHRVNFLVTKIQNFLLAAHWVSSGWALAGPTDTLLKRMGYGPPETP